MNFFGQSSQILADMLDAYAADEMTYTRGGQSEPVLMSMGMSENNVELRNGIGIDKQLQVFIVTAANLPEFVSGEPLADDVISYQGIDYTVIPYAGTKVFHNCDPAGIRIRIFTRKG
jgi:hypothetical protein